MNKKSGVSNKVEVLIIARQNASSKDLAEVRSAVSSFEGKILSIYPPRLIIASIPPDNIPSLNKLQEISDTFSGSVQNPKKYGLDENSQKAVDVCIFLAPRSSNFPSRSSYTFLAAES